MKDQSISSLDQFRSVAARRESVVAQSKDHTDRKGSSNDIRMVLGWLFIDTRCATLRVSIRLRSDVMTVWSLQWQWHSLLPKLSNWNDNFYLDIWNSSFYHESGSLYPPSRHRTSVVSALMTCPPFHYILSMRFSCNRTFLLWGRRANDRRSILWKAPQGSESRTWYTSGTTRRAIT